MSVTRPRQDRVAGRNTTAQERRVLGLYHAARRVTGTVHVIRKGKLGDSEGKEFQKNVFPQQGVVDTFREQGAPVAVIEQAFRDNI